MEWKRPRLHGEDGLTELPWPLEAAAATAAIAPAPPATPRIIKPVRLFFVGDCGVGFDAVAGAAATLVASVGEDNSPCGEIVIN
jgi:hypothetical protein